jgi:hypothetical protein
MNHKVNGLQDNFKMILDKVDMVMKDNQQTRKMIESMEQN